MSMKLFAKRAIALATAMALVVSFCVSPLASSLNASAATSTGTITAGSKVKVTVSDRSTSTAISYLTFTPEVSGTYKFYSTGNEDYDTWGVLLDSNDKGLIANDDKDDDDFHFYFKYACTAGETYTIMSSEWDVESDTYDDYEDLESAEDDDDETCGCGCSDTCMCEDDCACGCDDCDCNDYDDDDDDDDDDTGVATNTDANLLASVETRSYYVVVELVSADDEEVEEDKDSEPEDGYVYITGYFGEDYDDIYDTGDYTNGQILLMTEDDAVYASLGDTVSLSVMVCQLEEVSAGKFYCNYLDLSTGDYTITWTKISSAYVDDEGTFHTPENEVISNDEVYTIESLTADDCSTSVSDDTVNQPRTIYYHFSIVINSTTYTYDIYVYDIDNLSEDDDEYVSKYEDVLEEFSGATGEKITLEACIEYGDDDDAECDCDDCECDEDMSDCQCSSCKCGLVDLSSDEFTFEWTFVTYSSSKTNVASDVQSTKQTYTVTLGSWLTGTFTCAVYENGVLAATYVAVIYNTDFYGKNYSADKTISLNEVCTVAIYNAGTWLDEGDESSSCECDNCSCTEDECDDDCMCEECDCGLVNAGYTSYYDLYFTPTKSGYYYFRSLCTDDDDMSPYGALLDANGNELINSTQYRSDDYYCAGGCEYDYDFLYYCEAGVTYILRSSDDDENTGTYNVTVLSGTTIAATYYDQQISLKTYLELQVDMTACVLDYFLYDVDLNEDDYTFNWKKYVYTYNSNTGRFTATSTKVSSDMSYTISSAADTDFYGEVKYFEYTDVDGNQCEYAYTYDYKSALESYTVYNCVVQDEDGNKIGETSFYLYKDKNAVVTTELEDSDDDGSNNNSNGTTSSGGASSSTGNQASGSGDATGNDGTTADGATSTSEAGSAYAAIGTTFTVKNCKYVVTGEGEVAFTGVVKKKKNVNVPATVSLDNMVYAVTSVAKNAMKGDKVVKKIKLGANIKTIGANAFAKCIKLKKVTIGKAIVSIGKKAFFGCKKLSNIIIKGSNLKKVGKKAISGIKATAKIKVPKKKIKAYKKIFKKKTGFKSATMKIKK